MISTKGRYSIRILLDLAEHRGVGGFLLARASFRRLKELHLGQ